MNKVYGTRYVPDDTLYSVPRDDGTDSYSDKISVLSAANKYVARSRILVLLFFLRQPNFDFLNGFSDIPIIGLQHLCVTTDSFVRELT